MKHEATKNVENRAAGRAKVVERGCQPEQPNRRGHFSEQLNG